MSDLLQELDRIKALAEKCCCDCCKTVPRMERALRIAEKLVCSCPTHPVGEGDQCPRRNALLAALRGTDEGEEK